MSAEWYARRLAQQAPAAPPQARRFAPQPFQQPQSVPAYQPAYQQPGYPPQPPQQPVDDGSARYQPGSGFQHVRRWLGGEAAKKNTENCPQCGSHQYFTALRANKRLPPPAPHCYNCGYNDGLFDQGDPAVWGVA